VQNTIQFSKVNVSLFSTDLTLQADTLKLHGVLKYKHHA